MVTFRRIDYDIYHYHFLSRFVKLEKERIYYYQIFTKLKLEASQVNNRQLQQSGRCCTIVSDGKGKQLPLGSHQKWCEVKLIQHNNEIKFITISSLYKRPEHVLI